MTEKNSIQIIAYIKRNPALSLEEFYSHWREKHAPIIVPWAEKYGFRRYQQIHAAGTILPNNIPTTSSPSAPENEMEEFDGIAIFVVQSLEDLEAAFNDEYFRNVIQRDEKKFLDMERRGGYVVAQFQGKLVDVMLNGRGVV
ncbi:hypothetical protein CC80DRAFT_550164 [Byssothecium circinans]|uniref:EthD domain-containing protein n=1 Tax=Byssothecium circinans TaxID=147558 RepID=A0A6A5U028_9PLEO|nr:hypothetical protein CC80DRAFT_550164 [Byssothecium circinans]